MQAMVTYHPLGVMRSGTNRAPKRESGKTVLYGGVSPGMLYDAKTDQIMMDKILWQDIILKNMSIESTRSEWKVQRDLYDRSHLFDLEASLKMSFMSGLVKVKIS